MTIFVCIDFNVSVCVYCACVVPEFKSVTSCG